MTEHTGIWTIIESTAGETLQPLQTAEPDPHAYDARALGIISGIFFTS
jgi:hypothetical protein